MLQETNHYIEYSCSDVPDNQCLHLMYSEVAWVLASLRTQIGPQIILGLDHLQTIFPFLMTLHLTKLGKSNKPSR